MTSYPRWKQSDLTELRRRVQQGEDLEQIATGMTRAGADVRQMATRLRVQFAPAT